MWKQELWRALWLLLALLVAASVSWGIVLLLFRFSGLEDAVCGFVGGCIGVSMYAGLRVQVLRCFPDDVS